MKNILNTLSIVVLIAILVASCGNVTIKNNNNTSSEASQKTGVLLVNHGSRSETWRNALLELEKTVRDSILQLRNVAIVKTAFMEYTEPSIATRLKQMDSAGVTDVIIIPIFLTVSPHTFEDIPTIVGLKEDPESMEMIKIEKIERYAPKAKVHITPLLDFTDVLKKNVLKRTKALSENPEKESIVLIGYGDQKYLKEWEELFAAVADYVQDSTQIKNYEYGWCGHLVHYNPDETTKSVKRALGKSEVAIVIPVLVAHDEMFQIKIIGGGIEKVPDYTKKVKYKPDAILPDDNITHWILDVSKQFVTQVNQNGNT